MSSPEATGSLDVRAIFEQMEAAGEYRRNFEREACDILQKQAKRLIGHGWWKADCDFEEFGEFGFSIEGRQITCLEAGRAYWCGKVPGYCMDVPQRGGGIVRMILVRYQGGDLDDNKSWHSYWHGNGSEPWDIVREATEPAPQLFKDWRKELASSPDPKDLWLSHVKGKDQLHDIFRKVMFPRVVYRNSDHLVIDRDLCPEAMAEILRDSLTVNGHWAISIPVRGTWSNRMVTLLSFHGSFSFESSSISKDSFETLAYQWDDPHAADDREFFECYGFRNADNSTKKEEQK